MEEARHAAGDVLVHLCCGVCASFPLLSLKEKGYRVSGFFYNPNIDTAEEYERRLSVARDVCRELGVDCIAAEYDVRPWVSCVQGLEQEPEGGARCRQCYCLRLAATFAKMVELGYGFFASTLSVSPHKDAAQINALGRQIGKETFLECDFKKHDGFKKTMGFAKERGFYRQNYCGCAFSRRP